MLLLIDHLDSFSYNLVQSFQELGAFVHLVRSPFFNLQECLDLKPDHLVIGPGPGSPKDYPYLTSLIAAFCDKIPILGVCLGHQGIAEIFGAEIIRATKPIHGKTSLITHNDQGVFKNLPPKFASVRYNSLVVNPDRFPACLEPTAFSETGEIMGFKHRDYFVEGVQFHPESIQSENGAALFQNFLNYSV